MATIKLLYFGENVHVSTSFGSNESFRYLCSTSASALANVLAGLLDDIQYWEAQTLVAEPTFCIIKRNTGIELSKEDLDIIEEIHDRITQLQHKGISVRTIREALLQYQEPSPLLVTDDLRIILPGYDNLEISLTPLCKTLYLFFLQHPEGILLKHLCEHQAELLSLYERIASSLNPARRLQHIKTLTDPTKNSINEKLSQIRRAFADALDEELVHYYIISGRRDEIHHIKNLERHLQVNKS